MEPVLVAQALNALYGIASLAILALGLAVVLGLLGVLNLAHGELVMIGAYCAYVVQAQGWCGRSTSGRSTPWLSPGA